MLLYTHKLLCSEPANETQNIDLQGKSTENTEYAKIIIPRAQNSNDCIIQRETFTGLFEGATSTRAELDYKIRHDALVGSLYRLYMTHTCNTMNQYRGFY